MSGQDDNFKFRHQFARQFHEEETRLIELRKEIEPDTLSPVYKYYELCLKKVRAEIKRWSSK